ncbi:MAG: hypothetical protein COC15_01130 [Legionellales bacterium]|nr:MAG: hypothetical protein COC15_01130 [Legionellales bacterium]
MTFTILGFLVGILVTISGIGGATITTPALLLLGVPPIIAVGTDLVFAFITKLIGLSVHIKLGNVRWNLVRWLYVGGIPACLISLYTIHLSCNNNVSCLKDTINIMVAILLLITAMLLFTGRKFLGKYMKNLQHNNTLKKILLILIGIIVASIIAITSVGSGSITDVFLLLTIPKISMLNVIGTSLAFSTPITFIAGMGHLAMGNVALDILWLLLLGSIPGACIGAYCIRFTKEQFLTKFMAILFIMTSSMLLIEAFYK